MQRRYCEEGLKLDTDYFEKTRIWITAEADKRVALGASRGVDAGEWSRIARRAVEAKSGHEEALHEYMDHLILCPVCHAHVLSTPKGVAQAAH